MTEGLSGLLVVTPVTPRPVPGSLLLQKPYHPERIVEAVNKVTAAR